MEGFLTLIEGFLAFALTMLALTVAVSAIVGSWQRLLRWRAKGLRDMIRYLFHYDVRPLLEETRVISPPEEVPALSDQQWGEKRIQFVVAMTLLPTTKVGRDEDREVVKLKEQLQKAEEFQNPSGRSLWKYLRYLGRNWWSHGMMLDALPEPEFVARLEASEAGQELRARFEAEPGRWEAVRQVLTQRFNALGEAATENFARRSRYWTLIFGFVLAFGVNIDSFNLLNSYLTDPALRRMVIENQQGLINDTVERQQQHASKTMAQVVASRGKIEAALASISQMANTLRDQAGKTLTSEEVRQLLDAVGVAETATTGLTQAEEGLRTVAQFAKEAGEVVTSTRGVMQNLTQSFPIGWDRYPNCAGESGDARCMALQLARQQTAVTTPDSKPTGVAWVFKQNPAGFWKWFIGLVVTGVMLGLGTPFWIQVVNGFMQARSQLRGGTESRPRENAA